MLRGQLPVASHTHLSLTEAYKTTSVFQVHRGRDPFQPDGDRVEPQDDLRAATGRVAQRIADVVHGVGRVGERDTEAQDADRIRRRETGPLRTRDGSQETQLYTIHNRTSKNSGRGKKADASVRKGKGAGKRKIRQENEDLDDVD